MNDISADYQTPVGELGDTLAYLINAGQPAMIWGAPGIGKSQVVQRVAADTDREYIDIRALLLDPVDLRGIPWRDTDNGNITRWAPPAFLPPENADGKFLINLEELPAAPQMVQTALYQLVLDRAIGEYRLPDGAAVVACGNNASDRGVFHRMSPALASRFVHIDATIDAGEWQNWAIDNDIAPEVIFFVRNDPEALHDYHPASKELAFPCPRTWEFVSNIVKGDGDKLSERAMHRIFRGTIGKGAAIKFSAFLQIWRSLPDWKSIIDDPRGAAIPDKTDVLIALCGALFANADDVNFESICVYAKRFKRIELGEFLVGSCVRRVPSLQHTKSYIQWAVSTQ